MANISTPRVHEAIEWLKQHFMTNFGLWTKRVEHSKINNDWIFYDEQGELIMRVADDIMDRIILVLEKREWLLDPATLLEEYKEEGEDGA